MYTEKHLLEYSPTLSTLDSIHTLNRILWHILEFPKHFIHRTLERLKKEM